MPEVLCQGYMAVDEPLRSFGTTTGDIGFSASSLWYWACPEGLAAT